MSKNLSKYNKLLVISDTGIYQDTGEFYAFGPVVKELEELVGFERITWIGFESSDQKENDSYVKIKKENIKVRLLKKSGGKTLASKLNILLNYPLYLLILFKEIFKVSYIHVRAPSNPAVIAMFLSYVFPRKNFWFKYAGNWIGYASPFYKFQRFILKHLFKNSKITVNGNWENQPNNIIGFENPCLDMEDRIKGKDVIKSKKVNNTLNYCFVGGINTNKGVDLIIEALDEVFNNKLFGIFHFVGGGVMLEKLKIQAGKFGDKVIFHGFLPKEEIFKIYTESHFIVLPSKSEGFPKVIGEAMNYGCIPIVSDISCIDQYIEHEKNGFLIYPVTSTELKNILLKSIVLNNDIFKEMINSNYVLAEKFTYEYYENQIQNKIFN